MMSTRYGQLMPELAGFKLRQNAGDVDEDAHLQLRDASFKTM